MANNSHYFQTMNQGYCQVNNEFLHMVNLCLDIDVDYLRNFLNRRKLNDLYELQDHFKDHFQDKPRGLFLNGPMVHLCVQN